MNFYLTYGGGSYQRNNFSVVEADTYSLARQIVHEVCGRWWADLYTEKDFEGQAERYGLTEIELQPQIRIGFIPDSQA